MHTPRSKVGSTATLEGSRLSCGCNPNVGADGYYLCQADLLPNLLHHDPGALFPRRWRSSATFFPSLIVGPIGTLIPPSVRNSRDGGVPDGLLLPLPSGALRLVKARAFMTPAFWMVAEVHQRIAVVDLDVENAKHRETE